MGNQANVKALRKQLHNVVQDLLPGILTQELTQGLAKKLGEDMGLRMDFISNNVQETLAKINNEQKDFNSMILRQLGPTTAPFEPIDPTKEVPPTETL